MSHPSAAESDLAQIAGAVAHELKPLAGVLAIALIGSVARGDARPDSDIDLIVVGDAPLRDASLRQVVSSAGATTARVSFLTFDKKRWVREASSGSLFVSHASMEGKILHDPERVLDKAYVAVKTSGPDTHGEIKRQLRRACLYDDLSRLNGRHLFALSHLYAIGKAIAIARSFADPQGPTFVKEDALRRLLVRQPRLQADVTAIRRLRPFYDLTNQRSGALPFSHRDADQEVQRAQRAVRRIAEISN